MCQKSSLFSKDGKNVLFRATNINILILFTLNPRLFFHFWFKLACDKLDEHSNFMLLCGKQRIDPVYFRANCQDIKKKKTVHF